MCWWPPGTAAIGSPFTAQCLTVGSEPAVMIWGGRGEAKGEWKESRKERGEGGREDRRRG